MRTAPALALASAALFLVGSPAWAFDLANPFAWMAPADMPPASSPVRRHARHSMRSARAAAVGSGRLFDLVTEGALRHGIRPALAHAVVRVESNYNCGARNRSGALGIMQVLPATARAMGVNGDLRACAVGLEAGLRYLRLALAAGGHGCAGASLYERGLYARPTCSAYGRRVMALSGEA